MGTIPLATNNPRIPRATISILPDDLLRSVYVVGKTGSGKSVLLLHLLLGAVEAGFGACLIDPHGDLAEHVLELLPCRHWSRVVILRPEDTTTAVGINLLSPIPGMPRSLVASGIVEVFRKLWGKELFGPRSEHLLRHALLAVLEYPGTTLLSIQRLLLDEAYRMRVLARVTDPLVRLFWLKEFTRFSRQFASEIIAPVLNKLGALSAPAVRRVVGQVAPRVCLREVMDEKRILVCDLSGIGRDAAELLGALIVTGLGLAAQTREDQRNPFLLVADEFHAYITQSFAQLLAEGRKFGLCAALAHQHAGQLEREMRGAILGNVGTIVSFNLSAEDADLLVPEFAPEFTVEDLVRLRRYRIVLRLLRRGEPNRPTLCQTLPPLPKNGGPPVTLLRISRERYGRAVEVVDREIGEGVGLPGHSEKTVMNKKDRPLVRESRQERVRGHGERRMS